MTLLHTQPLFLVLFLLLFVLASCRDLQRTNSRISSRQDFHDELVRIEALALSRLPRNLAFSVENAAFGSYFSNDTRHELGKRADPPPGTAGPKEGQGQTTLNLYMNAQFKVPVNNIFVPFDLEPEKSIVMTTGQCFGCTAVIMCSGPGKKCIFAHFRQANTPRDGDGEDGNWERGDKQDVRFEEIVLDPTEQAMVAYEKEFSQGTPLAIVFTPGFSPPSKGLKYLSRIKGPGSINQAILDAFPSTTILNIGYNYMATRSNPDDHHPWGKIVLQWLGTTSPCATGATSVLNVFAEDTWWWHIHFDSDGNIVRWDQVLCQAPSGVEDVFDDAPAS